MLISNNWLKTYIPKLTNDTQEFRTHITQKLAEVEGFTFRNDKLNKLVVGEVLEVNEHPKSKKLHICKVDIGNEAVDIVCGATNVRSNLKVVVCKVGGSCLNEFGEKFDIDEAEIAGIKSQGMICSERELGLSSEHNGILELNNNEIVGTELVTDEDIKGEFNPDIVYEIENKSLTHRGDCFGIKGIAREVNAILELDNFAEIEYKLPTKTTNLDLKIEIQTDNCKRFSGIVIKGAKVGPSPIWLMDRLASVGMRPVNNIVDATNFVMMDLGQPIHAYDYSKIKGNKLIARDANLDENILTLDNVRRDLNESMMLICDGENTPVGIAGIMGGMDSEISNETRTILIEAANFEMFNIRRTSRTLGLRSEASTRFEKGLDPELTVQAINEVASLIVDIAGGEVASEIVDIYPEPMSDKYVEFDFNRVSRFLGISMDKTEAINKLKSLGINTDHAAYVNVDGVNPVLNTNFVTLLIPTWRRDINTEEDILEEIGRLYGYNLIEPTIPKRNATPVKTSEISKLERKLKTFLIGQSFDEMLSYTFVNDNLWENSNLNSNSLIQVLNPLSPELNKLRDTLLPSLLEKASINRRRFGFEEINYFELTRIVTNSMIESNGVIRIPSQPWKLGLLTTNKLEQLSHYVQEVLDISNISDNYEIVSFTELGDTDDIQLIFNPSQAGIVRIGEDILGYFGLVNPQVSENFKLNEVGLAELDLEKMLKYSERNNLNFKPVSTEAISQDITFEVGDRFQIKELVDFIKDNFFDIEVSQVSRFDKDTKHAVTVRATSEDKNIVDLITKEVVEKLGAQVG